MYIICIFYLIRHLLSDSLFGPDVVSRGGKKRLSEGRKPNSRA